MAERTRASRQLGSMLGALIGDALAMPVHWYYDRQALARDYGEVKDYLNPCHPHPDSILWRSEYQAASPEADILHEQAAYWGRRGVHYHQFLRAGENTLNLQLCVLALESMNQEGKYSHDDYVQRYIDFMTVSGQHQDTYVEECHRHFFTQRANDVPVEQCGAREKHIGGLVFLIPAVTWGGASPATARTWALEHMMLTHKGRVMRDAAAVMLDLLQGTLYGGGLEKQIRDAIARQESPLLGHPFGRWLELEDETVIGRILSPACYVQEAVPAVVYLALKYHDQPEKALIVNTNLGGDNAHRGALLGALLGAEHGVEGFPERWLSGLKCRKKVERLFCRGIPGRAD